MDQGGSGSTGGGGSGSGFDLAKLTSADKLVLGGGFIYFIWSFFGVWYKYDLGIGSVGVSGFRGLTVIAALLGLLAAIEVLASKAMSMKMNMPMKRGMLHLTVAGIGLLCTLLGIVVRPSVLGYKASISWGLFIALILSLVWTYGAFMMYSAPDESAGTTMMGGGGGTSAPS